MQMSTAVETENGEMIVKRVSVPVGLEELMEGLTKEVLLKKPKDIYVFASEYFARLLSMRERGNYEVSKQLRQVQSVTRQLSKAGSEKLLAKNMLNQQPKQVLRDKSPPKLSASSKKIPLLRKPSVQSSERRENERNRFRSKRAASNDETSLKKEEEKGSGRNKLKERSLSMNKRIGSNESQRKGTLTSQIAVKKSSPKKDDSALIKNGIAPAIIGGSLAAVAVSSKVQPKIAESKSVKKNVRENDLTEKDLGNSDVKTPQKEVKSFEKAVNDSSDNGEESSLSLEKTDNEEKVSELNSEKENSNEELSEETVSNKVVNSEIPKSETSETLSSGNIRSEEISSELVSSSEKEDLTATGTPSDVDQSVTNKTDKPDILKEKDDQEIVLKEENKSESNLLENEINKTELDPIIAQEKTNVSQDVVLSTESEDKTKNIQENGQERQNKVDGNDILKEVSNKIEAEKTNLKCEEEIGYDTVDKKEEVVDKLPLKEENVSEISKKKGEDLGNKTEENIIEKNDISSIETKIQETEKTENATKENTTSSVLGEINEANTKKDKISDTEEKDIQNESGIVESSQVTQNEKPETEIKENRVPNEIKNDSKMVIESMDGNQFVLEPSEDTKIQTAVNSIVNEINKVAPMANKIDKEVDNVVSAVTEDSLKENIEQHDVAIEENKLNSTEIIAPPVNEKEKIEDSSNSTKIETIENNEKADSIEAVDLLHDNMEKLVSDKLVSNANQIKNDTIENPNEMSKVETKKELIKQDEKPNQNDTCLESRSSMRENEVLYTEEPEKENRVSNVNVLQEKEKEMEQISNCVEPNNSISETKNSTLEGSHPQITNILAHESANVDKNAKTPESNSLEKNVKNKLVMEKNDKLPPRPKLKNTKTRSLSNDNLVKKDSPKENHKSEKQMRRIKSMDVSKRSKRNNKSRSADVQLKSENAKNTKLSTNRNDKEVDDENVPKRKEDEENKETLKSNNKARVRKSLSTTHLDGKSENKMTKESSFDMSQLRNELDEVQTTAKLTSFKSSYNPYILRQEIKSASKNNGTDKKNVFTEVSAAIKLQSLWRGFMARKNANKLKTEKSSRSKVENAKETNDSSVDENKIANAALLIQKLWRGFRIRKIRKETSLFGNKVEEVKHKAEVIKTSDDFKEKTNKSALKIQSVWRGYQVRKNINNIDKKFKEIANDEGVNKEISDKDIFLAVIKIQAGVRGYLQRKKNKSCNLSNISEENLDEGSRSETSTSDRKTLNDEEEEKSSSKLDSSSEMKNTLQKGITVEEPECVREHIPASNDSNSTKDDNNNENNLTALEREVKVTVANISTCLKQPETTSFNIDDLRREIHETSQETHHSSDTTTNTSEMVGNKSDCNINKTVPDSGNCDIIDNLKSIPPASNNEKTDPNSATDVYENAPTRPATSDTVNSVCYENNQSIVNHQKLQTDSSINSAAGTDPPRTGLEEQTESKNIPIDTKTTLGDKDKNNSFDIEQLRKDLEETNNLLTMIPNFTDTNRENKQTTDKLNRMNKESVESDCGLINSNDNFCSTKIESTPSVNNEIKADVELVPELHANLSANEVKGEKSAPAKVDETSKEEEKNNLSVHADVSKEVTLSIDKDSFHNSVQVNNSAQDKETFNNIQNDIKAENKKTSTSDMSTVGVINSETLQESRSEIDNSEQSPQIELKPERLAIDPPKNETQIQSNPTDELKKSENKEIRSDDKAVDGHKSLETVKEAEKVSDPDNSQISDEADSITVDAADLKDTLNTDNSSNTVPQSNILCDNVSVPDGKTTHKLNDQTSDGNDSSLSTDSADSVVTVISKNESQYTTPTKETNPTMANSFNIDQLKKEIENAGKPQDENVNNVSFTNETAATKIQSAFRGYRVRRDLPKTITERRTKRKLFDIKEEQSDSNSKEIIDPSGQSSTGKCEVVNNQNEEKSSTDNAAENVVIKNCEDVIPDDVIAENKSRSNEEKSTEIAKKNSSNDESSDVKHNKENEIKENINKSDKEELGINEDDKEKKLSVDATLKNEENTVSVDVKNDKHSPKKDLISEKSNISTTTDENLKNDSNKLPEKSDKVEKSVAKSIIPKEKETKNAAKDENIKKEDSSNEKVIENSLISNEGVNQSEEAVLITNDSERITKNHCVVQDSDKVTEPEPKIEQIEKNAPIDPSTIQSVVALNTEPEPRIQLLHTGEFHDTVVIPLALSRSFNRPQTSTHSQTSNEEKVDNVTQTPASRGETYDSALPLAVQLNEAAPAGTAIVVTSSRASASDRSVTHVHQVAQASNKDVLHFESASPPDNTSTVSAMETGNRNKTEDIRNGSKGMEAEAATKIQAGFRGYQVRKQLKLKNNSANENSTPRRTARRKSASKLNAEQAAKSKSPKQSGDIEEQSAVKIQAGIRGFLVRRRQKKQKTDA